jgi:hypothetical protein
MAKPIKLDRAAGEPRRRLLATDADAPDRPMRRAGRKHEFARMKRALRKAERRAGDGAEIGGTGATILKFRGAPLARLVDKKRIGTEELQAADDIAIAFHAQADALIVNPAGAVLPNASGAGVSNVESRIAEIEGKYMRATHGSDPWKTYWSGESGARMQQEYRGLLAAREQARRGRAG